MDQNFRHGHRERVRERFDREGLAPFRDYEALEMLLFFPIPRRDTKGMAHALIDRFGSLGAVLRAPAEELCAVEGIGRKTAEFLRSLLPFADYVIEKEPLPAAYASSDALGEYFVRLYRDTPGKSVDLLLLNNRCEVLRAVHLSDGDFGTNATRPEILIETAYRFHASIVVLGFHTEQAIPIPPMEVYNNTRQIALALSSAGIVLLENVMVAGGQYNALLHFLYGKDQLNRRDVLQAPADASDRPGIAKEQREDSRAAAVSLLSRLCPEEKAKAVADALLAEYETLGMALADTRENIVARTGIGEREAALLQIAGALYPFERRECAARNGQVYRTAAQVGELFRGILAGYTTEVLAVALFDAKGRLHDVIYSENGSVNAATFVARRLVEAAVSRHASAVAMAHNHPQGSARPSEADVTSTGNVIAAFGGTGVRFWDHFIVTEREYLPICRDRNIRTDAPEDFYRDTQSTD